MLVGKNMHAQCIQYLYPEYLDSTPRNNRIGRPIIITYRLYYNIDYNILLYYNQILYRGSQVAYLFSCSSVLYFLENVILIFLT